MAAAETQSIQLATQCVVPDKPRIPLVTHIITDDEMGLMKVIGSFAKKNLDRF